MTDNARLLEHGLPPLDDRDRAAVDAAIRDRAARPVEVREGDYIRFLGGELRVVAHVWRFPADKDGPAVFQVQTSRGGSVHMSTPAGGIGIGTKASGLCSFSGGLDSGVPGDDLTDTGEMLLGRVWVWHHGQARAHNGVDVMVPFRVWQSPEVAP